MCLYQLPKKENKTQTKILFGNKKERVFWKVVRHHKTKLTSYWYTHEWMYGINTSNRKEKNITSIEQEYFRIHDGIHVFTNKLNAKLEQGISAHTVILPVICRKNDLVSFGSGHEAVFTKVRLRKRDYEAAQRKISKKQY